MDPAATSKAEDRGGAGERARAAFRCSFGADHVYASQAPGRVNLIGEHTDYNGGLVLPTPIHLHCVAVAAPTTGPSHLLAVDIDDAFTFDFARDLSSYVDAPGGVPKGHWASYVLGVLHGYKQRGYALAAVNIAVASDIPIGAGLSSSAALEAATANLMETITQRPLQALERARLCRAAEHSFAGVPCGIMDQYAVVLGSPGSALLLDCATEQSELVPLPPAGEAGILIVDTQVRHTLADGEYAQRRAVCASAAGALGVERLTEADLGGLSRTSLSDEEFRCASHVLLENARVRLAADCLRRGDVQSLGQLMYESHASLRYDYRVSCRELDTIVDLARTIPGVYGARMTGAGFGGCAIVLANPAVVDRAARTIAAGFARSHGRPCRLIPGL